MTRTQVKWVKIVDPQLDTTISCKKTKFPPKKIHFKAVFGQKWAKLRKMAETANFELILQKNKDFFQKSGSIRLLSNTVPSFSCKENKINGRAQTTLKKVHIFAINSIFPLPRRFPSFLRNLIKLKF